MAHAPLDRAHCTGENLARKKRAVVRGFLRRGRHGLFGQTPDFLGNSPFVGKAANHLQMLLRCEATFPLHESVALALP